MGSRNTPDPLLGGATPKSAGTAPSKPPAPKAAAQLGSPAPSSDSLAALASTTVRPLEGGRDLRITNGTAAPAPSAPVGWSGAQPSAPSGGNPPSPSRWSHPAVSTPPARPDTPAEPVSRRDPILFRGTAPSANTRIETYEQAQAILLARGVKWQRLETWGDRGEWKFSCSIPNREQAFVSRTYEARATDYLSAVRAVLDQIDREQR